MQYIPHTCVHIWVLNICLNLHFPTAEINMSKFSLRRVKNSCCKNISAVVSRGSVIYPIWRNIMLINTEISWIFCCFTVILLHLDSASLSTQQCRHNSLTTLGLHYRVTDVYTEHHLIQWSSWGLCKKWKCTQLCSALLAPLEMLLSHHIFKINLNIVVFKNTLMVFYILHFIHLENVKYVWWLSQYQKAPFWSKQRNFQWYVKYLILKKKHWTHKELFKSLRTLT